MDLGLGYHQIEVHLDSHSKLAFIVPDNHKYRLKCMPFGPLNSALVFVSMMEDFARV